MSWSFLLLPKLVFQFTLSAFLFTIHIVSTYNVDGKIKKKGLKKLNLSLDLTHCVYSVHITILIPSLIIFRVLRLYYYYFLFSYYF